MADIRFIPKFNAGAGFDSFGNPDQGAVIGYTAQRRVDENYVEEASADAAQNVTGAWQRYFAPPAKDGGGFWSDTVKPWAQGAKEFIASPAFTVPLAVGTGLNFWTGSNAVTGTALAEK